MAKYKKVKRYHRSFYSPGMWAKKVVGIVVLVAVVLVAGVAIAVAVKCKKKRAGQ